MRLRVSPTDHSEDLDGGGAEDGPSVHDFVGRFADLPVYSTGIDAAGKGKKGGKDASGADGAGAGGMVDGTSNEEVDGRTRWERGLTHVPPTMMQDWDVPKHGEPRLKKKGGLV